MKIILVGGGHGSIELLSFFDQFDEYEVIALCEVSQSAPAISIAK